MQITPDEARERIEGVLKAAGIKVTLYGCECCGEFEAEFPDGSKASDRRVGVIECDGIAYQRHG